MKCVLLCLRAGDLQDDAGGPQASVTAELMDAGGRETCFSAPQVHTFLPLTPFFHLTVCFLGDFVFSFQLRQTSAAPFLLLRVIGTKWITQRDERPRCNSRNVSSCRRPAGSSPELSRCFLELFAPSDFRHRRRCFSSIHQRNDRFFRLHHPA